MYKPSSVVSQPTAHIIFKLSILASALTAVMLSTGCSTTPTTTTVSQQPSGLLDANSLNSLEDLLFATDMRAVEGDRLQILKHGDVWKRMTVGFKMDTNHWDARIDAQRSWFISRQPYLDRLSARASRYLYYTVKEAERRGMPTELALLPIIESSYDPAATSSAAAAGLWQFIPSTGRIYGLRQTSQYDGRRDVVESTRAAYEFLGSLYNQFGSWELALAAYNAGPGRIQQAINRNQAAGLPTDYWSLRLPQETMNYVPRFLAVAQIIKEPKRYGVSLPPIANRPHFREVTVPAGAQLNQISSITGLSRAELYALNPGHRAEMIDPESPRRILIPADLNPTIDAKLKSLQTGTSGYWANNNNSTVTTTTSSTSTPQAGVVIQVTPGNSTTTAAAKPNSTPSYMTTTPSTQTLATSSKPTATPSTTPSTAAGSISTSSTVPTTLQRTPQGAEALAAFANNAAVPSAPRIPVAVTPASNVQPIRTEPPISARERDQISAGFIAASKLQQPEVSAAEKEQVVKELTALAPKGTEVVDPLDGKIKLTAIQTSQSVAEQQGKDVSVAFAYPKSVAENTPRDSIEAKMNSNKVFEKTADDVVVTPPKGKRSTYIVVAGDTLAIIATKNGVNWRDIAAWNQIDPSGTLYAGTTLYLYDAKPVASVSNTTSNTVSNKSSDKPSQYVVQPNDSLTGVANQFGLTVQQLAQYNDLNVTSNLFVGQKLKLQPSAEPRNHATNTHSQNTSNANSSNSNSSTARAPERPQIKTKVYTVKRGEYFKMIADRYGLSLQELASLNDKVDVSQPLLVGQKLNVPLQEVATNNASNNSANNSNAGADRQAKNNKTPDYYVVQPGDSLTAIADRFNLPLSRLAALNGLASNAGVFVGQKLKLTGEVVENTANSKNMKTEKAQPTTLRTQTHVIKAGESLASISAKYNMQITDLTELNNLSIQSSIHPGQRIKVAAGNEPVASKAERSTPANNSMTSVNNTSAKPVVNSKNTEKYVVKAGESLTSIAARIGVSVQSLAELNQLKTNSQLRRGQNILLPKTTTQYKVKSGDSLIRLAARHGIEVQQLAEMNNIKPNAALKIGDVITIPN
ncbi:lytic transglycosylase [Acinetobacter larvae]|uniref:Lytic transglycosylase n=1 Tax=Acinetobacter larvae TaxID=1789224 RepID=A0A1B2M114_9GAMM|nr:LysM peptidoglycan-binding domain-containing protein [Acinetobacter larvae]AOA58887.1 lytic transglycosylase [Acinetobacter larvae]